MLSLWSYPKPMCRRAGLTKILFSHCFGHWWLWAYVAELERYAMGLQILATGSFVFSSAWHRADLAKALKLRKNMDYVSQNRVQHLSANIYQHGHSRFWSSTQMSREEILRQQSCLEQLLWKHRNKLFKKALNRAFNGGNKTAISVMIVNLKVRFWDWVMWFLKYVDILFLQF